MRALIIDDDVIIQLMLEEFLLLMNFEVDFALNGKEGIHMLKRRTYDIIFLDIKMPGIDGEQVLNILNRMNRVLSIVIISGHLTRERVIKLKSLGAAGFLTKPFDSKSLVNVINQVCGINIEI